LGRSHWVPDGRVSPASSHSPPPAHRSGCQAFPKSRKALPKHTAGRGNERASCADMNSLRSLSVNTTATIYLAAEFRGAALTDRSRRPVRYANQLPRQIESLIVAAKRDKPHWGARKIRELLVRRLDGDIRVPAKSTIHAVLHRHGH
jgi:hypothetical protein